MTINQALFLTTLVSIFFFGSESFQMTFKTEHRSEKLWNWSVGILIADTVLVRLIDGEWWPLGLLPSVARGLTVVIECLLVFAAFSWVLIMGGDLVIKVYKGLTRRS